MATGYRGFATPTIQEIEQRVFSDINNALPGQNASIRYTPLNAIAQALVGAAYELYGHQEFIARQTNVLDCEDENLDKWGETFGVIRKIPTYATGTVTFTGLAASPIPAGTVVQSASGMQFATTTSYVIGAGSVVANIKALDVGIDYNYEAGTPLSLVSSLSGINTAVTVISTYGGTSAETDDQYRARIKHRIQNPPMGGSQADYVSWALSQPGVTRAWCYPLEDGAGTATVRFVMDDTYSNGIPVAGDVSNMQTYLDSVRPITATITAEAPTPTALNITVTGISPNTTEVKNNAIAEITEMLKRKGQPGGIIRLSWIWDAISLATGTDYHRVTSPSADVSYTTGQIPVIGVVTWA